MTIRNCARAFCRGFIVAVAQTALFVVGVPLALLAMAMEWLAERVGEAAHWVCDKSEDLSHWRREALLCDVEQEMSDD